MAPLIYKSCRTTDFFYKICFIAYIVGLPNFWIEDFKLSKCFIKMYNGINVINNSLLILFLFAELCAFYTQSNLNQNQQLYLLMFTVSTTTYCFYYSIFIYHKKSIRIVLLVLTVNLKAIYNDPVVEKQMIHKSWTYLIAVTVNCFLTMLMINTEGYSETVRNNVPFTTIITAYPDVYDNSRSANVVRVITNYMFWTFFSRVLGTYILVTPLASALCYQYRNLCSYFYSLSKIIENHDMSQKEREDLYEKHFKVGIKMHLDTLWCTRQIQAICNGVFSGQMFTNVLLLVFVMAQMVQSDRNLTNLLTSLSLTCAVLFTTGLFMWNAGDITVEASHLSMAVYCSGWHNCQGQSSPRIRKLVAITMIFTQRPVVLKGLGYIGFSYQSYLTIVKSSYSLFSVLF